ncbi:MAG: radical SAM protein [Desulfobacterales bacterium]|nr:radical SAM protein [Desulfobacterales bacterium]
MTTTQSKESPEYMRMSLAAAMTLDFKQGLFYRNAKLYCINLLLTYDEGCRARCAYCGLSQKRPGSYDGKSFIRVTWPTYRLEEIIARISARRDRVKRICISMVTHKRAVKDTKTVCSRLRSHLDVPVSLLISPTILKPEDLTDFKAAGADKIGVAIDLATPELFDKFRGTGVGGPHKWEIYWQCLSDSIRIFGKGNAGPHLMVGMGETEKEMSAVIQRAKDMGGNTHLFSFFPEESSALALEGLLPPPMDQYRRIQIARYIIDTEARHITDFSFSPDGQIESFGLPTGEIDAIIDSGRPFETSGCTGNDGQVACNRPFGNSRPGPNIRNFPFKPDRTDIRRIRNQMNPESKSEIPATSIKRRNRKTESTAPTSGI